MKKIFLTLTLVLFVITLGISQDLPSYVPTDGLVAYYPFNGNANDESGNGYHGTVNGATLTADRLENNEKAYSYNGKDTFITLSNNFFDGADNGTYTINFWTKNFQENSRIFYKGGSWKDLIIDINFDNKVQYSFINGTNSTWNHLTSNNSLEQDKWYNITIRHEIGEINLYLNGTFEAQLQTNDVVDWSTSINTPCAGIGMHFGKNYNNCTVDVGYHGVIDDFGIWNRALTEQEIQNLYNSSSGDILLNGVVSAENNQIKNVADPSDPQDATTKNYVDTNITNVKNSPWFVNQAQDSIAFEKKVVIGSIDNDNVPPLTVIGTDSGSYSPTIALIRSMERNNVIQFETSEIENNYRGSLGIIETFNSNDGSSIPNFFAIGINNGLVWKNPLRIYYDNSSIKLGMHTSNTYADGNMGGVNSISLGHDAIAEGDYSSALGTGVKAYSNLEIALGSYNTVYAPSGGVNTFLNDDRIFVVGNGTDDSNRSDALVIKKSGEISVENNLIKNLADPTDAQDAATKNYIDVVSLNIQDQIDSINSSSSSPTTYSVGDIAQGGKVFWVDETGQHGLVVALEDAAGSTAIDWSAGTTSTGDNLTTLSTGNGIYAGKMNTMIIIATHAAVANDGTNFAAKACNEYTYTQDGVTYGDWYLPSKDELHLIKTSGASGLSLYSYNYWSSTEYDNNHAYAEVLGNYANNYNQYKEKDTAEEIKVRAIRSF